MDSRLSLQEGGEVRGGSRSYDSGSERLEGCREGPQAKAHGWPLEAEKSIEMGSPLKPPERTSPDDALPSAS